MEFLKRQRLGGEGTSDEAGGESLLSQSSDFLLNEDYLILQSLWRTELNAPELLPYCQDLVDNIKQALESQQVNTFQFDGLFIVPLTHSTFIHRA